MTPEEKAKDLFDKFKRQVNDEDFGQLSRGIECAKTCVREIITALPDKTTYEHGQIGYWKEVLAHLKNKS